MGTILNQIMPSSKRRIRIIKDVVGSPVLGNAYIGKEYTLDSKTAALCVKGGYAEYVDEKAEKKAAKEAAKKSENEKPDLATAIKGLNPEEDTHWTKTEGLPDLNALKEITGKQVSRADVEKIAPEYNRQLALDILESEKDESEDE